MIGFPESAVGIGTSESLDLFPAFQVESMEKPLIRA
jgi:hypothetical protein